MRKKEKDKDITNRKIRNEEFQKEIKILDARLHNKQITDSAYKEEVAKLVQKDIE
jgi:ATP-binding cassette subfamily B protein